MPVASRRDLEIYQGDMRSKVSLQARAQFPPTPNPLLLARREVFPSSRPARRRVSPLLDKRRMTHRQEILVKMDGARVLGTSWILGPRSARELERLKKGKKGTVPAKGEGGARARLQVLPLGRRRDLLRLRRLEPPSIQPVHRARRVWEAGRNWF